MKPAVLALVVGCAFMIWLLCVENVKENGRLVDPAADLTAEVYGNGN